jgi:hypothetical protein
MFSYGFGLWCSAKYVMKSEPVFVDLQGAQKSIPSPGGSVRNPICRTGPPGYIGCRNRFLGIDSWAP